MENKKDKIEKDKELRKYLDLVNKIAKAEYKSINIQHLIEFGELINIGIQTVDILINNKDIKDCNDSYISTAVKWAIRNELRRRYRWHGVRVSENDINKQDIREAIYKTILSTDELIDSDKPFEIKDTKEAPEEFVEFNQMSSAIKEAISRLPKRERELIEAKFFQEKKLHELSDEFSISPSRISRIIKAGLDKVKDELLKTDFV